MDGTGRAMGWDSLLDLSAATDSANCGDAAWLTCSAAGSLIARCALNTSPRLICPSQCNTMKSSDAQSHKSINQIDLLIYYFYSVAIP